MFIDKTQQFLPNKTAIFNHNIAYSVGMDKGQVMVLMMYK